MKALSSFILVFALTFPALALEVPPLTSRVTDQVGILGNSKAQLEQMLKAHETSTGQQFALLVIPTLAGDSLEDFSIRVVDKWKLGQKDKDNGLLLLVVHQDRKIRFEVGYGLEGDIPDALAGRIISTVMGPSFRAGKFGEGILEAFKLVIQAGAGEKVEFAAPPPAGKTNPNTHSTSKDIEEMTWVDWVIVLFMIFLFIAGRGRGGYSTRGGFSSGGFSSGGGGGGFSGGGGSFGGGGASGGW
ncbi:MAG: hypothetical protein HOI23_23150 [Deltaproteobacteria bacterium]|jgi:uncharacterized protein|nr:hypothetical protein [Deltaproteobacteria bacterium]MBT6434914.1 hypothetical protein [Deltaproteobacteria bacterium]MBT6490423.1 hypothetical protein [Deltaproteobacteria bacterium]